jgi:hypothetical protein
MNGRFQILCPRSGLYREAPFRGLYIFPIDRPGDALILRSSLCKAFNLLTTIRSLLILNPVRIAIFGCRFSARPKKAFGVTLEVRFEEMGSDEHVDSAIDSAVFQWLFSGRFGTLNCTAIPSSVLLRPRVPVAFRIVWEQLPCSFTTRQLTYKTLSTINSFPVLETDMATILLAAIAVLLALILIVLFFGLLPEQRTQILKLLLWPAIMLTLMGVAVAELIWSRNDYEGAVAWNKVILALVGGAAAFYGVKWFFGRWWWSPSQWRLALLLRKIKRECAPPLQFLTAKTVYVEDKSLSTEGTAYLELKKWGRFEIVADRAKAELILTLFAKKPRVNFSDWNGGGYGPLLDGVPEAAKNRFGYSFLRVTDPDGGMLQSTFVTAWQSHPRSATRDLIQQLRKEIRETEKWYGSK